MNCYAAFDEISVKSYYAIQHGVHFQYSDNRLHCTVLNQTAYGTYHFSDSPSVKNKGYWCDPSRRPQLVSCWSTTSRRHFSALRKATWPARKRHQIYHCCDNELLPDARRQNGWCCRQLTAGTENTLKQS